MSAVQKSRLATVAALPDDSIDYCDIPPLTYKLWKNAIPNPYFKPVKK
jgi:hypothetical protein